jgi:hypothetical protein
MESQCNFFFGKKINVLGELMQGMGRVRILRVGWGMIKRSGIMSIGVVGETTGIIPEIAMNLEIAMREEERGGMIIIITGNALGGTGIIGVIVVLIGIPTAGGGTTVAMTVEMTVAMTRIPEMIMTTDPEAASTAITVVMTKPRGVTGGTQITGVITGIAEISLSTGETPKTEIAMTIGMIPGIIIITIEILKIAGIKGSKATKARIKATDVTVGTTTGTMIPGGSTTVMTGKGWATGAGSSTGTKLKR